MAFLPIKVEFEALIPEDECEPCDAVHLTCPEAYIERMVDPDEVVIASPQILVRFSYPFARRCTFTLKPPPHRFRAAYFSGEHPKTLQDYGQGHLETHGPYYGIGIDRMCLKCDTLTKQRCSRCLRAYFCSKECQMSMWPRHKRTCKLIADTIETAPRPKVDPSQTASALGASPPHFTRAGLARAIVLMYHEIYEQENLTTGSPVRINAGSVISLNRPATAGKWGIMGHVLGDLMVHGIKRNPDSDVYCIEMSS